MVKEFIQIVRDKRTLAMIMVMPAMQLVLFGYAINTTVDHIPAVVADGANDLRSREFTRAVANTGYFDLVGTVADPGEARAAIDAGKAKVAFVIAGDFARESLAGRPGQVQVLIDGSDPNVASTAMLTAEALARTRGGLLVRPVVDLRPTVLYNPSLQSVNFMIPALIGIVLQMQAVMLTAFAIVRERERGTLEQLIVTPIRPLELMLGKMLPYVVIAFAQVGTALAVGVFWFGVPIRGNLLTLMALSLVFLLGALGMGLLISTVSRNQTQAMQTTMFTMLPSFLISGFVFPREAMPELIYWLSHAIPLTYFLQILRGVILKGVGVEYLWAQVAPLTLFGIGIMALSVTRFRRSLA